MDSLSEATQEYLESVYWLYNRTGDASLLKLADKLHRHAAGWTQGVPNWHNVNLSQGFREPAEWSMQSKNPADFAATVTASPSASPFIHSATIASSVA